MESSTLIMFHKLPYQSCQVTTQRDEYLCRSQVFAIPLFFPGDDSIASSHTLGNGFSTSSGETRAQGYSSTGYKGVMLTTVWGKHEVGKAKVCLNVTTVKWKHIWLAGQILDEEKLVFLADLGVLDGQAVQTIIPNNAAFQMKELDTYDSECDDISNAKVVLMANISNYGSDVILEVPHSETYLNDMENQSVHAMQDFEQTPAVDFTDNEIHSDSNIILYSQYLQETQQENVQDTNLQVQQDSMILSVIEQMSEQMINHVNN
ncbi:hypothetical protein Tco_0781103 [Tanacetum coccineum]